MSIYPSWYYPDAAYLDSEIERSYDYTQKISELKAENDELKARIIYLNGLWG